MTRVERLELLLLLLLVLATSAVFFHLNPYGGFFMASSITVLVRFQTLANGYLLLYDGVDVTSISGDQTFMYSFHLMTGVPYDTMQRLPIMHVVTGIAIFCLARRILGPRRAPSGVALAAAISAIYLVSNKFDVGDSSFFLKGVGIVLFLLFALALFEYSSKKTIPILALALILFAAQTFFDYTAQAWMIAFVIPLALSGKQIRIDRSYSGFWTVFVLMVVVFLGYRSIVYSVYVPWMTQVLVVSSLQNFLHSLPFTHEVTAYPFQGGLPSSSFVFASNTIVFASTMIVSCYYVLRALRLRIAGRDFTRADLVALSVFLPLPLTFLVYLPLGIVALGYAVLTFPLLSVFCLCELADSKGHARTNQGQTDGWHVKSSTAVAAFTVGLLILSFVSYLGPLDSGRLITTSNTDVEPAADWLFSSHPGRLVVLGDLDTLGKVLVARAYYTAEPYGALDIQFYTPQLYESIVTPGIPIKITNSTDPLDSNFILVDVRAWTPAASFQWTSFDPLSHHIQGIEDNPRVGQIYDDGRSLVLTWTSP